MPKSTFALIDVKAGRRQLAKAISSGKRVKVTITGYLQAGKSSIGSDDGESCEFAMDVHRAEFGEPETVLADNAGRPWAKLSDLKDGDKIDIDDDFDCTKFRKGRSVKEDRVGRLYFTCSHGKHFLDGQLDDDTEFLVGVYHPL